MPTETAILPPLCSLQDDPWSLSPQARRRLRAELADAQQRWLRRLRALVEPPEPNHEFPAFLLDTTPFARLRAAVGEAQSRRELDTATADELQRFVDLYRGYRVD